MKKILRAILPLGILALAVSTPAKASYSDCIDACEAATDECYQGCESLNCLRQCANFYAYCAQGCS